MQVDGTSSASEKELNNVKSISSVVDEISAQLKRLQSPINEASEAVNKLVTTAEGLNKAFIGNRTRVQEFQFAINQVAPEIVGLGGKFEDVGKTIEGIAKASRRNLVASGEDIRELFATSQVIGKDVATLVESFAKAGIMYSDISEKVEESIVYVNNIGVNAKAVMGDVVSNTDKLSRFNFQGGVDGLTKMAAQASMLRFDMKETFELADRVLDPDKAIEVASAFQRLGVSAGNLTDPFMLMNQSINDPSGLQDSLINVAKQFTYFDESAQQFKISPQGILTLKEMEAQTGVSAKSMREAALSAADFDKRIGEIKKTGLAAGFSEDDQKLIANLSRMNKDKGGYEIKVREIKDGKEIETYKKLTDLSSEQLKATIEAEKNRPQDIEDVQRDQLTTQEGMLANLKEINEKILRAVVGNPTALKNISDLTNSIRGGVRTVAGGVDADNKISDRIEQFEKDLANAKDPAGRQKLYDDMVKFGKETGANLIGGFKTTIEKIGSGNLPFNTESITGLFKDMKADISKSKGKGKKTTPDFKGVTKAATTEPTINNDFLFGRNKAAESVVTGKVGGGGGGVSVNETIEVKPISGKIDINVTATGADSKIIEEILSKGSVTLKERIFEIVTEQSKITPGRIK
jgi:hypothetical protein